MTKSRSHILDQHKTYQVIKRLLTQQLGRTWPVGAQLPPVKELARQLQAGQTNTHRAVRELVQDGLLISRSGQGTFVTELAAAPQLLADVHGLSALPPELTAAPATAPGDAAASQREGELLRGRHVLALTISLAADQFVRDAVVAFTQPLAAAGCRVEPGAYRLPENLSLRAQCGADAILLVNPNTPEPLTPNPQQPLIIINTAAHTPLAAVAGYDVLSVDSEQGATLAGQYARRQGFTRACFLGSARPNDPTTYDRTSTIRRDSFAQAAQLTIAPDDCMYVKQYTTLMGATAAGQYLQLQPRPELVFAASDDLAVGFMHGMLAHGLQAGRDYALIGFDGQQRGRKTPSGVLTTVVAPMALLGRLAASMLAQRLAEPALPPRRLSVGCTFELGTTGRLA